VGTLRLQASERPTQPARNDSARRRLLRRYIQRAYASTRTGERPNRVVLSVVGIGPAEIAVVLVLVLIAILLRQIVIGGALAGTP
jgi:hypothetical protein